MALVQVTARYESEWKRFENADCDTVFVKCWVNGERNGLLTFRGPADPGELLPGVMYQWVGEWTKYKPKFKAEAEDQFTFLSFTPEEEHTQESVVAYLIQNGEGLGFAAVRAAKLWELYGSDAVRKLREEPVYVADALTAAGLSTSREKACAMAAKLAESAALEDCTIEVVGLLAGRGFRKTLPKMVIRDKGNSAARDIRRNPFCLLPYPYVGFKLCDELWRHLKKPLNSIKRQAYCVWDAVANDPDGSTWVTRANAELALRKSIGSKELNSEKPGRPRKPPGDRAIRLAVRGGLLSELKTIGPKGPISPNGNITWLAVRKNAEQEGDLARMVADAMREPHCWPSADSIPNIDDEQPVQLSLALRGTIAILGGRPGTGKTFVAANLIRVLLAKFGEGNVGIGAPTNLAAQRLNEAMATYRVEVKARTNHSLLGRPRERGREWLHDELNPLPFKVLVFDEESMKNTGMMCSIFRARAKGTHVLLIGDINQLPPIEHGAPLRDLIAAGLPYGELKKIRRNSGGIVEACAAIAGGRHWSGGDNLEIIEAGDEAQNALVLAKLEECKEAGFDPVWDTRVIVARNETRRELNRLLQGELNPSDTVANCTFRINDKVICRENIDLHIVTVDRSDDDVEVSEKGDSVRISNGEIGRVLEISGTIEAGDCYMIVEVLHPTRVVRVKINRVAETTSEKDKTGTGCCFDLAYAVTYHSSQGSEFPWPILVARSGDAYMGSRELVYTGISRGKVKCKMIGRKTTWDKFCKNIALDKRKTLLKERVLLEQAKDVLANL